MLIIRNNFKEIKKHNYSVAIGNFDGIHKGHKYLLKELINLKKSKNDKIAVLSFTPHPVKLIAPDKWKKNLVKFRTKYEKLKFLGIDALLLITFSESFRKVTAEEFINEFLIKKINIKNIVVGEDFKFGINRKGNIDLLKKFEEKSYFKLLALKKISNSNNVVYSSSLIRSLIKSGSIFEANQILGYKWEVEGKVIRGKALGRNLGFPTANIKYSYQISPQKGIYACWVKIDGEDMLRKSAVSTGTRPHYNGIEEILEVYILNYSGNLYQKRIKVLFVEKIRNEEKFNNDKELISKMREDCKKIDYILSNSIAEDNYKGKK